MLPKTGCSAFDRDFGQIYALGTQPITSQYQLRTTLSELYNAILNVDLTDYDVEELYAEAPAVLKAMYELRISLRDRLVEWQAEGLMTKEAERALRGVFRASRYAADMLGELAIGYARMESDIAPYRAFGGPDNNTLVHPRFVDEFGGIEFNSGDVIIVRGLRANSAAIARVGDVDTQFSHASMIHIDEDGRHRILEALIEEGATISNFDYTLEHELGRAVLFRHKDPDLAALAADKMFERIKATRTGGANHIYYDFTMEMDDYTSLFCSKLIREGFDRASGGLISLPAFPTEFRNAPKNFLARIGVTAEESFAPGDMELETQFHAVAEWRDYRKTSDMRLMDMVMVKLFEWMEQKNYAFRVTFGISALSAFGRISSYFPNFIKNILRSSLGMPKIPSNMHSETIGVIAMLHYTAEPLFQELRRMERRSIERSSRPLHPRDIQYHLDQLEINARGKIGYLRQQR